VKLSYQTDNAMMILAESISKKYGVFTALDNISFTAGENELYGFIGPDGAGKTSLFRILTTLLLPDSGSLVLNGWDVVKDYRQVRKEVGYMPGHFSLYADLTVEENLSFFATVFGTTINANYDLIRDIYIQIEPFKKRLAGRLSGGMKQKLALSCALIHQPRILILDEPTTGVDAVSRKEFWELLLGLKTKGITILVSTPYMDEAVMCDRVSLIQRGKILATNTPEKIEESYGKQIYSVRTLDIHRLLRDLRDYPGTASVFPFGQDMHLTFRHDSGSISEAVKYLEIKDHLEIEAHEIKPGIEDVFMKLMGEM
jgi:ABC-type multidrug transport system ATPase subunit